jgi:thiol:disulfide interchange protein DsbD
MPQIDQLLAQGSLLAYGLIFIGGLLTAFTPCVYPLIPITVSVFGARQAKSKLAAGSIAICYVLGIAAMYAALGVLAASTGAVFGQFLSHPAVSAAVGAIFIALALSLLGLYEIQLPSSWQTRAAQVGGRGYGGAFAMGLVSGVIAAPCTGPVLGAVLAFVALSRNLVHGFLLLFVFALGLGLPFLLLAVFAVRLPKSGAWLEGVKSAFGVLLLAVALYFLKDGFPRLGDLRPESRWGYLVAALLIVAGATLGALHLSYHGSSAFQRARKLFGAAAMAAGLFVATGPLLAGPAKTGELVWRTDLEAALAQAKAEGKPVLVDIWADWCVACKELDKYTYSDPRAQGRLKGFVLVKLDFTEATPEVSRIAEQHQVLGLPTVLVFDASGRERPDLRLTGFVDAPAFIRHLDRLR